jgi:hypothetical protein
MTVTKTLEDFSARLRPLGRILDQTAQGWTVWTCAPIYGPDGKVHVFYERWEYGDTWKYAVSGSTRAVWLLHAVADSPEGPFTTVDTLVCPTAHTDRWDCKGGASPQVFQFGDTYAILYDGLYRTEDWNTYRRNVGMLTSKSLDGPWKRVSDAAPLIATGKEPSDFDHTLVCNPTMVQHPDGRYFLYYKGRRDHRGPRKIALAIAENLEGPYVKYEGNPILDYFGDRDFEDPFVWYDDNTFKMLAHDLSVLEHGRGLYFESDDGIHWRGPSKGYPSALELWGVKHRVERPIVLFKNGVPDYLFVNRGGHAGDTTFSGFVFKIDGGVEGEQAGIP